MIAKKHIEQLATHYEHIYVDNYVIMPNHVHLILVLEEGNRVAVEQVIAQYKAGVSREIGKIYPQLGLWQRSFHDHVIRDQCSYQKIWQYREENPQKWDKDCFYTEFTDPML